MAVRKAKAQWRGNLEDGTGTLSTESGAVESSYSFRSRFEEGDGTNPEELIGAAHAGCFSMAFANELSQAGYTPDAVETEASVHLTKQDGGFGVTRIDLDCVVRVVGVEEDELRKIAEGAKKGCPISRALAAIDIHLDVRQA